MMGGRGMLATIVTDKPLLKVAGGVTVGRATIDNEVVAEPFMDIDGREIDD